jgi:hypothetical protein
MSTATRGELDPKSTASTYGFSDGEQIIFSERQIASDSVEAAEAASQKAASQKAASQKPAASQKQIASQKPSQPQIQIAPPVQPASSQRAANSQKRTEANAVAASAVAGTPAKEQAPKLGRGRGRKSAGAGNGRGQSARGPVVRTASGAKRVLEQSDSVPKSQGSASIKKAKAKLKAKAKAKATAKAKGKASNLIKKEASSSSGDGSRTFGAPSIQKSLVRVMTGSCGPARGWKLYAWLAERKGMTKSVRWRSVSPDRTQAFDSWAALREAVGEGVYTHIHCGLRPQLYRKITARRKDLEEAKPSQECQSIVPFKAPPPERKKRAREPSAVPALKNMATKSFQPVQRSKRQVTSAYVAPLASQSVLPTQALPADVVVQQRTVSASWTSECKARLRRHPGCSPAGKFQPDIVYITKESMIVGRLESCDVVIDSTATPQMISRRHALLTIENSICKVIDQGALNGLLVNGSPMRGEHVLANGDVVTFGVETLVPELNYMFEERPKSIEGSAQGGA